MKNVKGADWQHPRGPGSDVKRKGNHPMVLVSWDDAVAFCRWASQVSGKTVRLPSEAEWEKAARGTDGRIYPWGNQLPDKTRCNFDMNVSDTTAIGQFSPSGDSPYGCTDMAGNVGEWVVDRFGEQYYSTYPIDRWPANPPGPSSGEYHVWRGGSWYYEAWYVRTAPRGRGTPNGAATIIGFRCAS